MVIALYLINVVCSKSNCWIFIPPLPKMNISCMKTECLNIWHERGPQTGKGCDLMDMKLCWMWLDDTSVPNSRSSGIISFTASKIPLCLASWPSSSLAQALQDPHDEQPDSPEPQPQILQRTDTNKWIKTNIDATSCSCDLIYRINYKSRK